VSFGEYPEDDAEEPVLYLPAGRVTAPEIAVVEAMDPDAIVETVAHAWYADSTGAQTLRHPSEGETSPEYAGPPLPFTSLEGSGRYSWLKAARYNGLPAEVGPLARLLVAWGQGHEATATALGTVMTTLSMRPEALTSTLGRIVAKAVEAQMLAGHVGDWLAELRDNLATGDIAVADLARWDPGSWPTPAEGWSLGEGPRGSVGHWVRIEDRQVRRYQVVDGSTWNLSPRRRTLDRWRQRLPARRHRSAQPLEILRTVHSFSRRVRIHARLPRGRTGARPELPMTATPASAVPDADPGAATSPPAPAGSRTRPRTRGAPRRAVPVRVAEPGRITHWLTAGSQRLSITSLHIDVLIPPGDVQDRFIHIVSALAFLLSGLLRTYWLLAGNRFARWSAFIPTNRFQAMELFRQAGFYAMVRREIPKVLGHNQLAATAYLVLFALLLVEVVTGFALDGLMGAEPGYTLFAWLRELLGPQLLRFVHHAAMWAILAIALFHIYSCVLVDHVERNGLVSSIIAVTVLTRRRSWITRRRPGSCADREGAGE
jgi:Ni,Fe-hydrogenase I cytochrome b subunit